MERSVLEEQLAKTLLPYLEVFDKSAISTLAVCLKYHGIDVKASAVAAGSTTGSMLTFAKQAPAAVPHGDPLDLSDLDVAQPSASASEQANFEGSMARVRPVDDHLETNTNTLDLIFEAGSFDNHLLASAGDVQNGLSNQPDWLHDLLGSGSDEAMYEDGTRSGYHEESEVFNARSLSNLRDPPVAQEAGIFIGGDGMGKRPYFNSSSQTPETGAIHESSHYQLESDLISALQAVHNEPQPVRHAPSGLAYGNMLTARDEHQSELNRDHVADDRASYNDSTALSFFNSPLATPCTQSRRSADPITSPRRYAASKQMPQESPFDEELPEAHLANGPLLPMHRFPSELRALFGERTKRCPSDDVLLEVIDASENFIRPDLLEYLEGALPRWQQAGIWHQEQLPQPLVKGTGRAKLFNAYSCICKLEARLDDDQIRNRMATMTLHSAYEDAYREWRVSTAHDRKRKGRLERGRGDASSVIDDILENLHEDWHDSDRKVQLRSRFHDKKRYGKRWLLLTKTLGISVLIACSSKIASVVHNTAFTAGMLEVLAHYVRNLGQHRPKVLEALNPGAESILYGDRCDNLDHETLLNEIRTIMSKAAQPPIHHG